MSQLLLDTLSALYNYDKTYDESLSSLLSSVDIVNQDIKENDTSDYTPSDSGFFSYNVRGFVNDVPANDICINIVDQLPEHPLPHMLYFVKES